MPKVIGIDLGTTNSCVAMIEGGDPVVITGNPARDAADQRLRMVTVKRTSDGFSWGFRPGQTVD